MTDAFEIDFFAVGGGKKSGDAIALRFGTPDSYQVLVYDGGTKESGRKLVEHIRKHYKTDRVDFMVNSHPDLDHASGLSVVLEELEVGELWMHQPWNYSSDIRHQFDDERMTDKSLGRRLQEKMAAAHRLELLAEQNGTKIYEPFQGAVIGGVFTVLSPEKAWYVEELIQDFGKSPAQKAIASEAFEEVSLEAESEKWVSEDWEHESLRSNVESSAENESSVVLLGRFNDGGLLLTGDAGILALDSAVDFAASKDMHLPDLVFFAQVPHHGSRNNVSTPVMDRIFGPPVSEGEVDGEKVALVSVAEEADKHPDRAVVNAFIRRNFSVYQTKGDTVSFNVGMGERSGWGRPPQPLSFSYRVRAW